CIPIPSEVIMTFAGALAGGLVLAGVHVHLNIVWVGLAGTVGNLVGGLLAYAVGRAGGRPLLERWGKFILLRPREIDKAERFFQRRGQLAVLVGRIIPVVRTFISLPAGVAEMPVVRFGIYTFVGSLPWVFALAAAGDALASNWKSVSNAFTPISIVFGVLILCGIAFWYYRRIRANRGQRGAHARQG
ncbi:MAG: DedA family protein, partial [Acidimicrobiales bacterium]